jgi:hypothetical protein
MPLLTKIMSQFFHSPFYVILRDYFIKNLGVLFLHQVQFTPEEKSEIEEAIKEYNNHHPNTQTKGHAIV